MKLVRSDRGQATVLTVVVITALLCLSAFVLDVGSWYRAQRETQAAADAAALAAAQALPEEPGRASALAAEYLGKNGGGAGGVSFSSRHFANDTVTVRVNRDAPGFFAKVFGVDSVNVAAKASARAGGIESAKWVAPIVVNVKHPQLNCGSTGPGKPLPCFGEPTEIQLVDLHKPGSSDAAGSFGLINLDQGAPGNVGAEVLGTWITQGFDQYMSIGLYNASPSTEFNSSHIQNALDAKIGDELLFPIYRTITGSGQNAKYDVIGWVGFTVSGKKIQGDKGKVFGAFTKVIWEGIQSGSGANLNYGARTIELVD